MKPKQPKVTLEINEGFARWSDVPFEDLVEPALSVLLQNLNLPVISVSVLLTDDETISGLNEEFRGNGKATNVLSWPAQRYDNPPDALHPFVTRPDLVPEVGDIALAFETICEEATAAGIPRDDHIIHLTLHGVLHCLGFDHQTDETAHYMEGIERKILVRIGIPDPYSGSEVIEAKEPNGT
ncbi:MAG: rRNA maturation RNase YbeY [Pseudomonadota bacterium]